MCKCVNATWELIICLKIKNANLSGEIPYSSFRYNKLNCFGFKAPRFVGKLPKYEPVVIVAISFSIEAFYRGSTVSNVRK